MHIKQFINFYKECYEADSRTVSLNNFFSSKVENQYFIEGDDELLNGHIPKVPIDPTVAQDILQNLSKYQKEKSLYVFAFFAVGKSLDKNGKAQKTCAPLFFYPATIEQLDTDYYLSINRQLAFPNIRFLEGLRKNNTIEIAELFEGFLDEELSFKQCGNIKRTIENSFHQLNGDQLLFYPKGISLKQTKAIQSKSEKELCITNSISIGVIRHSSKTLGILSELDELEKNENYSRSIKRLFDHSTIDFGSYSKHESYVPIVMSKAQRQAIAAVNNYDESMIIGPPGTGKSFTIAALAIDQANKGNSVLVVSKTDQAVDVILNKIENEIGVQGITVRGGRGQYMKDLKIRIKNILTGLPSLYANSKDAAWNVQKRIKKNRIRLRELETELFNQIDDDLKWGDYLFKNKDNDSLFSSIWKKYLEWKNSWQTPHWNIVLDYYKIQDDHLNDLKEYVHLTYQHQLWRTLKNHRTTISTFLKGLRANTLAKQDDLFSKTDFDIVFNCLPVWLCSFNDLFEVLPHKKELFDIVIIDEASQCDMASCLPAIQRAKKVVIVGDSMQLRHYSFLSRKHIQLIRDKNQLGAHTNEQYFEYRDSSILDLYFDKIGEQEQVVFLDEHYRGNASLIEFSNKEFYGDKLKVMKALPHSIHNAVEIIEVIGKRNEEGVNKEECELIIKYLKDIICEQQHIDPNLATSIGILSPFRQQVAHIESQIHEHIPIESANIHQIKVGTPYSFQGDERGMMLISWTIDDKSHATAMSYLNTTEVFNVAITRAKYKQILFTSFTTKNLNQQSLLGKYMLKVSSDISSKSHKNEVHDDFSIEVQKFFRPITTELYVDYIIAGIQIDLLLDTSRGYFGVDLIGYPGKFFDANSIEEYEILSRAGVTMLPLPYSNWYYEQEKCKKDLKRIISMSI